MHWTRQVMFHGRSRKRARPLVQIWNEKGRGGEESRERERPLPRFDASSGERDFGISDQARLVLPVPS